jgi:molybdate transport system ATP-binding protein
VGGSLLDIEQFQLNEGQTTVVFGPNGAGKSTLLRFLAGVEGPGPLPEPVYLQQRPYLFRGTAGHNLGLGLNSERAAWARQLADQMGIDLILEQSSETLSGGERQRLVLARTLAYPGDWVLLDEPLAAIDHADRPGLLSFLTRLLEGRSAVVVTHDIGVVATLADDLIVLDRGRILQQGPVAEVMGSPSGVRSAEVLGMANLIGGIARDLDGMTVLKTGPVTILGMGEVVGEARALFGAEAVTLRYFDTHASSARNTWKGSVESVLPRGQLVEVAVDIGVRVVAVVTPGALVDLDLKPGDEIGVSVKASAVQIVPA